MVNLPTESARAREAGGDDPEGPPPACAVWRDTRARLEALDCWPLLERAIPTEDDGEVLTLAVEVPAVGFAILAAPKREAASDAAFVYEVPSHLARLHRNGKITSNMVHAASRFHGDWVTAGLVGLRIAQLTRLSGGGETDGLTGAVLDARNRIHRICDRLGGFNQPGF